MNPMNMLRPFALATTGGCVFVLLALWAAPQLGIRGIWMILLVVAIIVLWVAVILILRWRAKKAAAALEKSIEQQAEQQIASSRPGREEEIEHLKTQLLEAIAALKASRAAKGRGGSGALYVLPWYMIIGPPAAGKTTLLANSGLNYPYLDPSRSRASVKGVGGTRNCDWWFADEAVILDTAGRYVLPAEADDSQEWLAFLDLLRRHRKKKPINGLIVGVSIQDLLTGGEENAEFHAQKIRTRIDELIKQLGVTFPIYVLFTKCDLIRGFVEFFGELSKTERASAWGATIAIDRATREPAAQLFDERMDELGGALRQARIPRIAQGGRPESRQEVLFFPLQFGAVRPRLSRFVEILFRENPYQERPVFRGFYFTSGTQEGRPIDQVINAMLRGFGLPEGEEGMYVEPTQTKSYFIENVFSKVIFPDRHIAGPSAEGERRRRALRVKVFAAGCIGLALLTVALFVLSASNRALLGQVRKLSDEATSSAHGGRLDFSLTDLKTLEALRARLDEMDRRARPGSKVVMLATYQGERAAEASRRLLLSVLRSAAIAPAAPALGRNLRAYADSTSLSAGFSRYYNWYRTWRILQDPAARLKKREDAAAVAGALADYWASVAQGGGDRLEFERLLRLQLEYASRFPQILSDVFPPDTRRDESLDYAARAAIRRYWSADGIYRSLVEAGEASTAVTVASLVGGEQGLSGAATVPGAFTMEGWSGPVRKYLDWLETVRGEEALRTAWDGDPPRIRDDLLSRYGREYAAAWGTFLGGVRVKAGAGPEETGAFLERAATEGSPILKVLRGVDQNTRFEKESDPALVSVEESFGALHEFFSPPGKGNAFKFLKGQISGEKAPYAEYVEKVGGLKDRFAAISAEKNPARSAPVLALTSWVDTRIPGTGQNAVATELARALKLPANAITRTVEVVASGEMGASLQDAWGPVAREFQETLAGRYPLSAGGKDAALADFEKFFAPGGTFWSFYDASLAGIVSEDGRQVTDPRAHLSPGFLGSLNAAWRIRRALFADGSGAGFSFSAQTEPPERDKKIVMRSVRLDVGGQSFVYQMGPKNWVTIEWPGKSPESGGRLSLDAGSSAKIDPLAFDGAWGFFRLLDKATIGRGASSGELSLGWHVTAQPKDSKASPDVFVKYDLRGLPAAHPFQKEIFRFSCPAQIVSAAR